WQTVGAELLALIHRLLRVVEQQAAACPLRLHDAHGVLRDCLMGEEIQLEGLAQRRLIHLANAALPGSTRVRNHNIYAAEAFRHGCKRAAYVARLRYVTGDAVLSTADLFRHPLGSFFVAI